MYHYTRATAPGGALGATGRSRQEAHLEEVVLVHHAAVGQVSDQPVGEGGLSSIGHAERKHK